jgi:hypothetical protein
MYQSAAIVAAAVWLIAFAACAALGRPRSRVSGTGPDPRPVAYLAGQPPALVSFVTAGARLSGTAYPATIVDLAARGYLRICKTDQGELWCRLPPSPVPRAGLAEFELRVLSYVSSAVSGSDGAPFDALAAAWQADPQGRREPFERAVRYEARRRGLTGPRIPAIAQAVLLAGAVVVASLTYLALHARPHAGQWAPIAAGFATLIVLGGGVLALARKDRLTRAGAALASRAGEQSADPPAAPSGRLPGPASREPGGPSSGDLPPLPQPGWPVPAQLLTIAEAIRVLGKPVSISGFAIPRGGGIIYRAGGSSLILTISDSTLGRVGTWVSRRSGTALPGIGDRAWLLNRSRTVVVHVGAFLLKISLSGGTASVGPAAGGGSGSAAAGSSTAGSSTAGSSTAGSNAAGAAADADVLVGLAATAADRLAAYRTQESSRSSRG